MAVKQLIGTTHMMPISNFPPSMKNCLLSGCVVTTLSLEGLKRGRFKNYFHEVVFWTKKNVIRKFSMANITVVQKASWEIIQPMFLSTFSWLQFCHTLMRIRDWKRRISRYKSIFICVITQVSLGVIFRQSNKYKSKPALFFKNMAG